MEDKNIYKISLECIIGGTLDEDIQKDMECRFYFDNKKEQESIESFSREKIGKYFQHYLGCKDKWKTIEIMVYWNKMDNYAYEITTGIRIPLLIVNEQVLPSGVKRHGKKDRKLKYYNYSEIAKYGYFGKISYSCEKKKSKKEKLKLSQENLEQLKKYIQDNKMETNEGIISFQSQLQSTIQDSQAYVIESVKNMVNAFQENKDNSQNENAPFGNKQLIMTRNTSVASSF